MNLSKTLFLILFLIATYFLSISCGLSPGDLLSCIEDSDCGASQICLNDGQCEDRCEDDGDCLDAGYTCLPKLRSDGVIGNACIFDDDPIDKSCSTDADCRQLSADAQCSIDHICFVPQTLYSILIRDSSPDGPLGMDGQDGADIGAVFLTTGDDIIVAQGSTLVAKNGDGDDLMSPIKGGPPTLNFEMTCIAGDFTNDTVHLGRNGFLLVRFLNTSFADYLEGPSNWKVNVIEWGKNCGIADDGDTYTVSLCTTSSYENIDFERECVQIGNGEGFSKFTTQ